MTGPRRVRVGIGPLIAYADGFASELVSRGYSPSAVKSRLGLLDHASGWLKEEGLLPSELTAQSSSSQHGAPRATGPGSRRGA
ncbi:MAG: hypothetical protein QOH66_1538 [Actinomycetota bacterium]|nr:hypothetical protein [Actinomycetota bacterium]